MFAQILTGPEINPGTVGLIAFIVNERAELILQVVCEATLRLPVVKTESNRKPMIVSVVLNDVTGETI